MANPKFVAINLRERYRIYVVGGKFDMGSRFCINDTSCVAYNSFELWLVFVLYPPPGDDLKHLYG